ncbi:transporter substrate-binding domain-containing protein [Streptomyces sp. BA2]|uniref:transporter substrate-binding domain-containing protein n=1 Tax=Streptomyces sp. BA2 TaxID=436595 RepID=UPI00136EBAA7|nr:transporter substrate-binding domain-containing protein [Streptomyces sp. BA2]
MVTRKVLIHSVVVSSVLFVTSTVCAAAPAHSAPSADLKSPLKVCTTGDYMPLTSRDKASGEYSGFDIDMAQSLSEHLGRKAEFVQTSWPTMMQDLLTPEKCDITMGGVSDTADRRKKADLTAAYLVDGKAPVVRSGEESKYQTLDQIDRKDVRVIVNPGGTNEQLVKDRLRHATVITWPDNVTIFDEIKKGHADVMITDALEGKYQAKNHPGLTVVNPEKPFTRVEKVYMLPKGSPLTSQTNSWLTEMKKDGAFDALYAKWLK